ncbi:beta-glucosidase family protein [Oerskovia enterophila]|uniref:beta-d-glucosidase n=1 Tax=Oerskovia enterophila TaxID=43678 RepID=UPI003399AF28
MSLKTHDVTTDVTLDVVTDVEGTEERLARLTADLTVEEKVSLLVGAGMWTTTPIERIGLRAVAMSDGPVGVRGTGGESTLADGSPVTAQTSAMFPAPSALSATWDRDLAARAGALFASEARRHGVDVVLAPQINLQRTPVGGRHFECYSEDPHLTAEIAVELVRSSQAHGVGMSVKHYVANDSETERTRYLARLDERTLREVYLPPFERVVHEAQAWSVMGAYSGVDDGETAAPVLEHRPLLTGVLKDEWGFDGVVVSDWVATKTIRGAVEGGLDLQMPGPDGPWGDGLLAAVRSGEVAEGELDDKVLRLLRLAHRVGALDLGAPHASGTAQVTGVQPDDAPSSASSARDGLTGQEASAAFLRELVARSIVVLKNEAVAAPGADRAGEARGAAAGLVPLDPAALAPAGRPLTVALLGPAGTTPFLQGGGSSFVVPDRVTTPEEELRAGLPEGTRIVVHDGARSRSNPPALDVSGRCSDPVTGAPGLLVELLDAHGQVLDSRTAPTWDGWLQDVRADAVAVRVRADVDLEEPGTHELGIGTVGVHTVTVDGRLVSTGDVVVNEDVVLSSGHNHPVARTVDVEVTEPRTARLDATLQVVHAVGYASFVRGELVHRLPGATAQEMLDEAVAAATEADVVVLVVGTTEEVESEGYDRPDLDLPGNQDRLAELVLAANPRTVVVVNAGAPVLLPWLDDAPAVLWAWLGGQEAGSGLADALLGVTEPSGRLPWTLPARFEDVPVPHAIPQDGVVEYTEGLDVGYRAWERTGTTPAAPFGHGLGWSTWEYVGAAVVEHPAGSDSASSGDVLLDVSVRNTGERASREVVQVYVEPDAASTPPEAPSRPVRWLGGFAVVDAAPGELTTVRVRIPARALQIWDVSSQQWVTAAGGHVLRAGRSIRDLRLRAPLPA